MRAIYLEFTCKLKQQNYIKYVAISEKNILKNLIEV